MIEEGMYSVESLGGIFIGALVNSRHDPVVSRILLFSKIEELLQVVSVLGCILRPNITNENISGVVPTDNKEAKETTMVVVQSDYISTAVLNVIGKKRAAEGLFDRSPEKKLVRLVCDGKINREFEVFPSRDAY